MTSQKALALGGLACLAIYLFVSAPPPLEASVSRGDSARAVPVGRLFDAMDGINAAARHIYTGRIVGAGMKAGLKFGEDWAEPGVEKGPLPALFLRLVARQMEARPPRLGLYLGSDAPINKSNLFTGAQAAAFETVKVTRAPVQSHAEGTGYVGMYPDFASARPCVTCHNDHLDSPKTDWKLDEVMGATTWTYPDAEVPPADFLATTEAFYASVEEAYRTYLAKAAGFPDPPIVGALWPEPGVRALPSAEVFMAEVRAASAEEVLVHLVLPPAPARSPEVSP